MTLSCSRNKLRQVTVIVCWLILLLVLTSCCRRPWQQFEMSTPPDRSCRTGTTHGYDVYIWNCYNNQKVAVYQYSAEMSCWQPQKEAAPCGQLTPIENTLGAEVGEGCQQVPEIRKWSSKL